MAICVFRTDLRQQPVSEHLSCVDGTDMFYLPAAPTIWECVQKLLSQDEICLGSSDTREIMRGARVVGYIRILNGCEC